MSEKSFTCIIASEYRLQKLTALAPVLQGIQKAARFLNVEESGRRRALWRPNGVFHPSPCLRSLTRSIWHLTPGWESFGAWKRVSVRFCALLLLQACVAPKEAKLLSQELCLYTEMSLAYSAADLLLLTFLHQETTRPP